MKNNGITVETYSFRAFLTGRHVRMATKVTFADGREVKFMERMSKREAISQALYQIEKGGGE